MVLKISYIAILSTLIGTLAVTVEVLDCSDITTYRYRCGESNSIIPSPSPVAYDRPIHDDYYSPNTRYGYMGKDKNYMGGGYMDMADPYFNYHNETMGYYAAHMHVQNENTHAVLLSGSVNINEDYDYVYLFNVTTDKFYPIIDNAYFRGKDLDKYAEVVFGLQFADLVEFDDANGNGLLDTDESILSVTTLHGLSWNTFKVANLTVPGRSDFDYFETSITSKVKYKNDAAMSDIDLRITFRTTNVQTKEVAAIPLQPASLQYDFDISNMPQAASPNLRLAVGQVLSGALSHMERDINQNTTTSDAERIRQQATYGLSLQEYPNRQRLEYQTSVNLTVIERNESVWNTMKANRTITDPFYDDRDKLWGRERYWDYIDYYYLLVSVPVNGSTSGFSGSTYIGTPLPARGENTAQPRDENTADTLVQSFFPMAVFLIIACLFV